MKFIKKEFYEFTSDDVIKIIPLSDVHIGAKECDEKRLKAVVNYIASDPNIYWIGLGDYCDFITRKDPRFSVGGLADWIEVPDLADLAAAQRDRFLEIVEPIAGKCLAMVQGNHETSIERHYERAIYLDIVNGVKEAGGHTNDLALYYNGWLWLSFYRSEEGARRKQHTKDVKFYLHHGFGGGRLAGGKALNMQRMLWAYSADIVLMGHTHDTSILPQAVVECTRSGKMYEKNRYGARCGTFLKSFSTEGSTYPEVAGYFPLAISGVEIELRPMLSEPNKRIRMRTGAYNV